MSWSVGTEFEILVDKSIVIGLDDDNEGVNLPSRVESDPLRNGLKRGDVGYDGYVPHLLEGVFFGDEDKFAGSTKTQHFPNEYTLHDAEDGKDRNDSFEVTYGISYGGNKTNSSPENIVDMVNNPMQR